MGDGTMKTELNLEGAREGNELHRVALEQQVDRTANQAQTMVESMSAQAIRVLALQVERRKATLEASDNAMGKSAIKVIREIVGSAGFTT